MSDTERFLASIIDAPDDDVPRLVFADWLEERGETERAEFIRVQIADANEPSLDHRRRAEVLLKANRSRWIIPDLPGVQTFHRGFVEHLHISADGLIANAARIGAAAPIVGLRLSAAADRTFQLVSIPWLARLRRLEILNDSIGPKLQHWFRPGAFPELRSLDLRNNRLWADYIGTLARLAGNLPKLERLNLSGNPLGDDGLAQLAASATFGNLRELVIASDGVDDEYRIGSQGMAAFATASAVPRLRTLVLDNQSIGDGGFLALIRSPALQSLDYLNLSRTGIGSDPAEWIRELLESNGLPNLKSLVLRGNAMSLNSGLIGEWSRLGSGCTIDLRGCVTSLLTRELIGKSRFAKQILLDDEVPE